MNGIEMRVCSNCGAHCGVDSRMGAIDHYLVCDCSMRGMWIDDGRGGYWVCTNNARPITIQEYQEQRHERK
jgi:hypothetical protein